MARKSLVGLVMTILMFISISAYIVQRLETMLLHRGTRYLEVTRHDFVDSTFLVNRETGFNLAFGLTSYDGSPDVVEDEDYATMQIFTWSRGYLPEDYKPRHLPTRICSAKELGLEESDDPTERRFFPMKPS